MTKFAMLLIALSAVSINAGDKVDHHDHSEKVEETKEEAKN